MNSRSGPGVAKGTSPFSTAHQPRRSASASTWSDDPCRRRVDARQDTLDEYGDARARWRSSITWREASRAATSTISSRTTRAAAGDAAAEPLHRDGPRLRRRRRGRGRLGRGPRAAPQRLSRPRRRRGRERGAARPPDAARVARRPGRGQRRRRARVLGCGPLIDNSPTLGPR